MAEQNKQTNPPGAKSVNWFDKIGGYILLAPGEIASLPQGWGPRTLAWIGIALAGTAVGLMNMGSNITGVLFPLAGMSMLNMEPIWSGLFFGGIGFVLAGFLALKLTETGRKAGQQT